MTQATAAPAAERRAATPADLERLFDVHQSPASGDWRGDGMPKALATRYDGALAVPLPSGRPLVIANFVSTLDGVVALDALGRTGGGEISGFFEPDRLVMALLRSLADVVVVGAGTVRAAPTHRWTAAHVHPASSGLTAEWRERLDLVPQPTTLVVTRGGELPAGHPGLSDAEIPVVLLTTPGSRERVPAIHRGAHVRVESAGDERGLSAADITGFLRQMDARVVLCEGGPNLFGDLVAAEAVDELFLTLSPRLAGRDGATGRLGLVEGVALDVAAEQPAQLVSVHRAGDHLFTRYRFAARGRDDRETR